MGRCVHRARTRGGSVRACNCRMLSMTGRGVRCRRRVATRTDGRMWAGGAQYVHLFARRDALSTGRDVAAGGRERWPGTRPASLHGRARAQSVSYARAPSITDSGPAGARWRVIDIRYYDDSHR